MASYGCAFLIKPFIKVDRNFRAACSPQRPSSAPSSVGRICKDTQISQKASHRGTRTSDGVLSMRFFDRIIHPSLKKVSGNMLSSAPL